MNHYNQPSDQDRSLFSAIMIAEADLVGRALVGTTWVGGNHLIPAQLGGGAVGLLRLLVWLDRLHF